MLRQISLALTLAATISLSSVGNAATEKSLGEVKSPPLPAIRGLALQPTSLRLLDGRDERRVLVLGKTDSGKLVDLTTHATFNTDSTNVEITADGYIKAKAEGDTEVTEIGRASCRERAG